MSGTMRCGRCGLTQFSAEACRRCGTPLVPTVVVRARPRDAAIHPLRDIWFSPRDTVRTLVASDPTRGVLVLSWFVGLAMFLEPMTSKANDRFPIAAAMVTAVLAGPMLSFGLVFLQALLTTGTGRLLGGEASPVELRAAFAWAQAPLLGLFLLWWPEMWMPGGYWKPALAFINLAIFLWAEVLAVVLVAEVHGFSNARALGAILLAWVIKIALLIGLLLMVPTDPAKKAKPEARICPERSYGAVIV
jgi:hypothetical protein